MSSLYLCQDCSGTFSSLDELHRHEQQSHNDRHADSPTSPTTPNDLKMEEETMSDTDSSMLSMNGGAMSNAATLMTSPSPITETKTVAAARYECDDCHEHFSVKRDLATHMRIHSGEQPHSCTQCGKEFGTRQLLKKHWMWHTGQRSHVCPHCNKAFFQKGHLTQHLMIHSGGRPHECQQCHKTFIFKFDLNRHMKIHQERGFSCQQCGRSFLKQLMLDEHYLKCKGKPSSPSRSSTISTIIKAESPLKCATTPMMAPHPPTTPLITSDQITKMAQKIFAQQAQQQHQQQQQQQRAVLASLLMKHDQNQNLNQNKSTEFSANNIPISTIPLMCVICKNSFNDQSTFAIHTYMHHIANQNNLTVDSGASNLTRQVDQSAIISTSDADPATTDTSCASSPQKSSPFTLESCLEQSSISPGSSSSLAEHSPRPTMSESSAAATQCKDCAMSWQRMNDLEQQIVKKGEEFENYRKMIKMVVASVTNLLTQSSPENVFVSHATNVFKQLQNSL